MIQKVTVILMDPMIRMQNAFLMVSLFSLLVLLVIKLIIRKLISRLFREGLHLRLK